MFGLGKLARIKEISDYVNGQSYAWNRCLDKYSEFVDLDIWGMFPDQEEMAEIFVLNGITTVAFDLPLKRSMKFVEGVNAYMNELYERMDNVSA